MRDIDGGRRIHDCNVPHGREYYHLFQLPDGATYMLPRPDGTPPLTTLCEKATGDVKAALDRYGWCDEVAAPSRVNAMKLADALIIAHALHVDMKFVATPGGIWPRPSGEDVEVVCKGTGLSADLKGACVSLAPRNDDLYIVLPPQQNVAMAAALNKLYGIK